MISRKAIRIGLKEAVERRADDRWGGSGRKRIPGSVAWSLAVPERRKIAHVRMRCQATRRIGRNSSPVPEYGTVLNADISKQNNTNGGFGGFECRSTGNDTGDAWLEHSSGLASNQTLYQARECLRWIGFFFLLQRPQLIAGVMHYIPCSVISGE